MGTTIRNLTNHPVVIVLDHTAFQNSDSGWRRDTAKFASQQLDGSRAVVELRRSYPGTLRIEAGGKVEGLHPAIVKCAQVATLIERKVLVASEDKPTEENA